MDETKNISTSEGMNTMGGGGGSSNPAFSNQNMSSMIDAARQQISIQGINNAAAAQLTNSNNSLALQDQQYQQNRIDLSPYADAGLRALRLQLNYLGINGPDQQRAFLNDILNGPEYSSMINEMYKNSLNNKDATGGLRGGITEGINYFNPRIISSLINQKMGLLGGMTTLGQNSAASIGMQGMNYANQGSRIYNSLGEDMARNALAIATINNNYNNRAATNFYNYNDKPIVSNERVSAPLDTIKTSDLYYKPNGVEYQ